MKCAAALFALALCASLAGAQNVLDCALVPGWEQTGAPRQYDSSNLYQYKDGAAEGYFIFGFVRMSTVECKAGANMLTMDLSEMTDADAAYGLFSANVDPAQAILGIGMGAQVQAQSASFAKGKYYVELVEVAADPSRDDSATLRTFVGALEARLQGRATPPVPISWFPEGKVAPVRMVPESVLGLHELQRGYVAKYSEGQAFIVLENSPDRASFLLKALRNRFPGAVSAEVGDEAFQVKAPYLGGFCIFRKGTVLAGYANLADGEQAASRAAALADRIP